MHVEQNFETLLSTLLKKKGEDFSCHKNVYVVFFFFCTNGITPVMEVLIITQPPRILFRTKSPWFHLSNGATPAGRGWYRRRDLVRLGWTENPSKSQLSHFFENDKWIRLQLHVFCPLGHCYFFLCFSSHQNSKSYAARWKKNNLGQKKKGYPAPHKLEQFWRQCARHWMDVFSL